MTKKPDATEVPIGLDGHLDVADDGRIGLGINDIEVVDLMRVPEGQCFSHFRGCSRLVY